VSVAQARRFLLVTLDAAGNWPPGRALVRALARRGHEVRVATGERHAEELADAGAVYRLRSGRISARR
jgi:UDP:flavonoid glycosyltransferase YjiC (YdhE family)